MKQENRCGWSSEVIYSGSPKGPSAHFLTSTQQLQLQLPDNQNSELEIEEASYKCGMPVTVVQAKHAPKTPL